MGKKKERIKVKELFESHSQIKSQGIKPLFWHTTFGDVRINENTFIINIGDLIIKMIEDVEQSFEDGYLYIEKYGKEDDYFESEDVNDYVFHFVTTLPEEIKYDYIEKLNEVLNNSGYSTFMSVERKLNKTG